MEMLKKGSSGARVSRIQDALKSAGYFNGNIDGIFENETDEAVKRFQSQSGLPADGMVGAVTWARLFPVEPVSGNLATRCLALTGLFETGKLSPGCFAAIAGNFDGQGISYGVLQWNLGQKTLQPLLNEMITTHPEIMSDIFGNDLDAMQQAISGEKQAALNFANTIQDTTKHVVSPLWRERFKRLGLTTEFQAIEKSGASKYYNNAKNLVATYSLWSMRGQALMFDICVQNGSISDAVKTQIMADFSKLSSRLSREDAEVQKMVIIANRRAEAAIPEYVEIVRKRKLCIAYGKGVVNGISYDLATQFGLDLSPIEQE
ncbi:peptidoglycan-binding protein [Candidatus Roizmanbacteria bacterium]|nr:peptidoglycan-binding protein [Candidatus Roizmanbacteria bacterium]